MTNIKPMKVVFRADASIQMGSGHIMRCLTLADAMKEQGAECHFISRKHSGHLQELVRSHGQLLVHSLSAKHTTKVKEANEVINQTWNSRSKHVAWLGCHWQEDAEQTKEILREIKPDWLIVDHYALDSQWEINVRPHCRNLMVIDDLADRKHDCEVLLDQTYGRKAADYQPFILPGTKLLLGVKFSLLRPEFARWRNYSLSRRSDCEFKKLLITIGGMDPENVTGQVLEILMHCELEKDLEITVILGEGAPWLEKVKSLADKMPYQTTVKVNVNNMAEIMANSDLAIGAAGGTTWERCCLGLPTIQLVIADNQITIAETLSSMKAVLYLKNIEHDTLNNVMSGIEKKLAKLTIVSSSLIAGSGTFHVLRALKDDCDSTITETELKPICESDCQYLYELQTKPEIRQYFRNTEIPGEAEHKKWFTEIFESDDSVLFIIMDNRIDYAGMLRVDGILEKELEVSIMIAPDFSGKGLAKKAIDSLVELIPGQKIKAVIHSRNIASQNVFEKTGFKLQYKDDLFWCYTRNA